MEGILIFSIGLDYIKGTVFDENGCEKKTVERPLDIIAKEEYVEQDPEKWFEAIIQITSEFNKCGMGIYIENIMVIYEPGTTIFIDSGGNHVMNAVLPCDRRAKYQARVFAKDFRKQKETNIIPWTYTTLPILLWIKYNNPEIYRRIYKILTPDGYLAYRLCGETAIDQYSAVFLGYNAKYSRYNTKILNSFGFDKNMFPSVCRTGECIGVIGGTAKEELGFKKDVKFIMATNDLMLQALKCDDDNYTIIYDPNTSNISTISESKKIKKDDSIIRVQVSYDGKSMYGYMGDYEASFTKWIKSNCSLEFDIQDGYIPGSNGVIVLPYMMGSSSFYNSDIRGSIMGVNSETRTQDILTACYESLGYILADKIESMKNIGLSLHSIVIYSDNRNEILYQIISDITSMKVTVYGIDQKYKKYILGPIFGLEGNDSNYIYEKSPDEKKHAVYRQLSGLFKSTFNAYESVSRYRRRLMKRIDI